MAGKEISEFMYWECKTLRKQITQQWQFTANWWVITYTTCYVSTSTAF